MEPIHDAKRLAELRALPLERKILITQARIIEWNNHFNGNVCVSFSGGKDSTVLLNIARKINPDMKAVFSNTGLEYPEIQRFVKSFDNVDIVTPKIRFDQVISTYGYPVISKEVAEAIYYARRIRSQLVQVERERERERTARRKRTELHGDRKTERMEETGNQGGAKNRLIQTSTARNRRTVLSGRMPGTGVAGGRNTDAGTSEKNCTSSTSENTEPG